MFRKLIYSVVLFTASLQLASAQNSQVLYYMNLPQNHLLNPALRPSNSFYFGLPALTGVNIALNNNFVNLSDIFLPGKSDSIITFLHPDYNLDDFINKLKSRNSLSAEAAVQLLGLGFSAGNDMYIFLDIIERMETSLVLPGDIIKLGLNGNEDFLGQTIDLSELYANFKYYREYGLGFSKDIGKNLRIGVRAKLLTGIASMNIDNRSLGLTVNNDYSHSLHADLSASISAPVTIYFNQENQPDSISLNEDVINKPAFYLNMGNRGFGIDIGAVYHISDRLSVSASLSDFGYIRWKDNVTNLEAESHFEFSGFNISDVVSGDKTFEDISADLLDSLKRSFIISDSKTAFTTSLATGITLGASYNLTKSISFGLLSHSTIAAKHLKQAVTFSANINLGNALSTSLSYSARNNRYDNFGAGIAFRAGCFQIYAVADRIPVIWNRIIYDYTETVDNPPPAPPSEITKTADLNLPANWNTAVVRLGLNLVFGNKVMKKNDKPMLMKQNQ